MLELFNIKINVQSAVEQPQIYIFAHCADTIADKLAYVELRREDILSLRIPISVDNIEITDIMRFFQGDYFFKT